MKLIAVNGSPRKNYNTAALLNYALEGAKASGAETELIHLYDYDYKGCQSCFACKRKNTKTNGHCAYRDGLTQVLDKIHKADAFIIGAPVYLGSANGMTASFFERLVFPYIAYGKPVAEPKFMKTGNIYTLGADEEHMRNVGFDHSAIWNQVLLERIFGSTEYLLVNDTYQFDDYSNYETDAINLEVKTIRRNEVFPKDCKDAYELGARLVEK
jgi:multimeric flavodoxin WrbA